MFEAGEIFVNGLDGDPAGEMFEDDPEGDPVGESVIIDSLKDIEITLVFLIDGGSTSVSDSGNNVLRSVKDSGVDFSVVGEENLRGVNGDGVGVEGVAAGDGGNPDDVRPAGDS